MNKKLLEKVEALTKDFGVSKKYLNAITEKLGGSIADDSEDKEEIEKVANLIASVSQVSQAEATRWVNESKKKTKENSEEQEEQLEEAPTKTQAHKKPNENVQKTTEDSEMKKLVDDLKKELEEMKEAKAQRERQDLITAKLKEYNIPTFIASRLSFKDDEDIDKAISGLKKELIVSGLLPKDSQVSKEEADKILDKASDDLLEMIQVTDK